MKTKTFKHRANQNSKKLALITGAASGIGYHLALLLAKSGYNLMLVDIDDDKLKLTKNTIQEKYSVNITVLAKDLSQPRVAVDIVKELDGSPVEVLVNNAGFGLFGNFSNTNWQRESDMLHLHVMMTTHLTKLLLKGMVRRGRGKILNLSSLAAFQPGPLMSIYYASKAYILSFSEAIARELKGTGVSVTALCPGPTKTGFQGVVAETSLKNKIKFNMASAQAVAQYGYDAMMKGKTVAIPGKTNWLLANLPRFFPRSVVTSIVKRIQEKNRFGKLGKEKYLSQYSM